MIPEIVRSSFGGTYATMPSIHKWLAGCVANMTLKINPDEYALVECDSLSQSCRDLFIMKIISYPSNQISQRRKNWGKEGRQGRNKLIGSHFSYIKEKRKYLEIIMTIYNVAC